MLKYEIPFDKEMFEKHEKTLLPILYSVEYRKVKISAIVTITLILIGVIIQLMDSDVGSMFIAISIFTLFSLHHNYEYYKSLKNDHKRMTKWLLKELEYTSSEIVELRDDCFRYSTDFYCWSLKWNQFEKYIIKKSQLILFPKDIEDEIVIISEKSLPYPEFVKILNFIETKRDLFDSKK